MWMSLSRNNNDINMIPQENQSIDINLKKTINTFISKTINVNNPLKLNDVFYLGIIKAWT